MTTVKRIHRLDWWRHVLRALIQLNAGPWRWSVGIQAGLAAGIPLAAFTIAGHQAQGLTASLGAFTALYCARFRLIDRLRALPLVATGFVLAAAIGTTTSAGIWSTLVGLIVVAVLACAIAFGIGLGPPGPMMFVLVAGVSGHITAPASLNGAGTDRFLVTMLVAIGAFSAYLIVVAPLLIPWVRQRNGTPSLLRELFPLVRFDYVSRVIISRVVLAVTIASVFSVPLGVPRAYWVVMTAGVLLQSGHTLRIPSIRAIQRVMGTILGVGLFVLMSLSEPSGFWIVVIVPLFQCVIEVVVVRNYGLAMLFITPLALTISTAVSGTSALVVGTQRILDTLLGAAIAMSVLYATEWRRRRSAP